MPFDALADDGGDDPAAALRAWITVRVSCAEAMVASGIDQQLREAALLLALIDHEFWQFWVVWDYEPELGLLGERLDLLREILEQSGPL